MFGCWSIHVQPSNCCKTCLVITCSATAAALPKFCLYIFLQPLHPHPLTTAIPHLFSAHSFPFIPSYPPNSFPLSLSLSLSLSSFCSFPALNFYYFIHSRKLKTKYAVEVDKLDRLEVELPDGPSVE